MATNTLESFFDRLQSFAIKTVAPIAERLDHDSQVLATVFDQFKQLGGLNLLVPKQYGGLSGTYHDWGRCNALLAKHSGALLFLQTQHQGAMTKVAAYPLSEQIEALYQKIVDQRLAVATAHRPGQPLTVKKQQANFSVSGFFPWVSGHQLLDCLLFNFADEQYQHLSLIPFSRPNQDDDSCDDGSGIDYGEVMKTVVVSSVNTVQLIFNQACIEQQHILSSVRVNQSEEINIAHISIYSLIGVCQALLDEIADTRRFASNELVQQRHQQLSDALADYNRQTWLPIEDEGRLRAQGVAVADSCGLLLRLCLLGKGLLADQRAERLNREVWLYTATGFKESVLEACLRDLNFAMRTDTMETGIK